MSHGGCLIFLPSQSQQLIYQQLTTNACRTNAASIFSKTLIFNILNLRYQSPQTEHGVAVVDDLVAVGDEDHGVIRKGCSQALHERDFSLGIKG